MLRAGRVCRRINQIPRKGHGQRQRYRSYHGWRNNFRSERFSQYASHPTFSSAAWMVGALITGGLLLSMSPTVRLHWNYRTPQQTITFATCTRLLCCRFIG